MTSERNESNFSAEDGGKEILPVPQPKPQSCPETDSVFTNSLMSDGPDAAPDLKRFDLQKEQLANKIQQLEALVKEATADSPLQTSVDGITSPEMEFRSYSGLYANPENIPLLREASKGEPTVNRSSAEIPPAEKTHFEVYSEPLENDDLNEAIASSSETLVGEGPEDQTFLEDGAGGMTPTYIYRDSGSSFPFRDAGRQLHLQTKCESDSSGGMGDVSQFSTSDCSQSTSSDNFVKNFFDDDFFEMRVNDVLQKESEFVVTQGHPKGLPVLVKSNNSSSNISAKNNNKNKLKSSNLDGPSCRPKERRKQLKKSWSNQEALEPPASPDRRASYNDLFSFTADEFYRSRLGGLSTSNFENISNTYSDDYNDVSLDDTSLSYGEDRLGISYPNLDMNGRNIAEQINLTFKSKYNYDSELKLPVDIKPTPTTPFGLPPDPSYASHLNSPRNVHRKHGSEMRSVSPRIRRISKPLSVAETNKIYSSIKKSSKKMHRQLAVSDEGESLGSSISSDSQLHEQLHPGVDSFNCGGERNEELANFMELQRRTKLFFENMKKTDHEKPRSDHRNYNRGRHSIPKEAADLPRSTELKTSNIGQISSKSHDELDPHYDEEFYGVVPGSTKAQDKHHFQNYDNSIDFQKDLNFQDFDHATLQTHSKFPPDSRPAPPTSLKFKEVLPATSLFPPFGPIDRARSGPSTPIRPENTSMSSPRIRSYERSIHDSYDLATRLENVQHRAYNSQPGLLENPPTEQIRRAEPFAMTTFDSFENSSPAKPFETSAFEASITSEGDPSSGDDFQQPTSSVSDPPPQPTQVLLKPPEDVPVRRGSIVSCDTLQASLDPHPDPVKIVVLGDDGVGKTALIVRLVTGRFIGDYDPSLEAVYSYRIPLTGYTEQLQLMDTAGQGAWRGEETQLQWADAVLVVFSVTSARSLEVAGDILKHLKKGGQKAGKEGSDGDGEGGKRDNQEQAGVNENESNERNERLNEDDTAADEGGQRVDGQTIGKCSYIGNKVEENIDRGEPATSGSKILGTIFCPNQSSTQRTDCMRGESNEVELCQEPAGVASLRKLAMTTLKSSQPINYTDDCASRQLNNQKHQGNGVQTSKLAALFNAGFENIEDLKMYSKPEVEINPQSVVKIHGGRKDVDTSTTNTTTVGKCTSASETDLQIQTNRSGIMDTKIENHLKSVQTDSKENRSTISNASINFSGADINQENDVSSITGSFSTKSSLKKSSNSEDEEHLNDQSLQQGENQANSSQLSPYSKNDSSQTTEVTESLQNIPTSVKTNGPTSSSTVNLDKKNLSETPKYFLYKETVLLGNKSDLEHRREVSTAEGSAVAEQYHCCHYTEIAASAPWEVVSEPFLDLYRQVIEGRERKLKENNCDNKDNRK